MDMLDSLLSAEGLWPGRTIGRRHSREPDTRHTTATASEAGDAKPIPHNLLLRGG
jgi:hypothetical protein